jgi:hypothetical protein
MYELPTGNRDRCGVDHGITLSRIAAISSYFLKLSRRDNTYQFLSSSPSPHAADAIVGGSSISVSCAIPARPSG